MPANLTPQYLEAERRYRQAVTPAEQLEALREMLALVPKHKGTEKLQADIKRRLAQLRRDVARRPAVSRQRPIYVIEVEGAGQVPVLGGPNAGKSALVAALTGAPVKVADYPYTTQHPAPAMMPFENVQVQLIDTPPASSEYAPPWLGELVRRADAVVLVADLSDPDGWEAPAFIVEHLADRGVDLVAAPAGPAGGGSGPRRAGATDAGAGAAVPGAGAGRGIAGADARGDGDLGLRLQLPTTLVGTKADAAGANEGRRALLEYFQGRFPLLEAAAMGGQGLEEVRRATFLSLGVIRVYSKEPGKPPDRDRPWILPAGSTVGDLARCIHHDLAARFRYGRVWGSARFQGQRVGEEYVLSDQDTVEIHAA